MQETITELEKIINKYTPLLTSLDKNVFEAKPSLNKWSKKEIVGHMIDSAQNNIRRFIVAQYEDEPHIVYRQDDWVKISNYQNYPAKDLVDLWVLLNKHICIILKNIPAEKQKSICVTEKSHTIEWLASDYNKHLLHHLHQVLDLEPIAYS